MREIYFATFLLGKLRQGTSPRIEDIAPLLEGWLFDPRHSLKRPSDFDLLKSAEHLNEKSQQIRTAFFGERLKDRFACRFEHPDQSDARKIWQTDVGLVANKEPDTYTRFSISLSVGKQGHSVEPLQYQPSRPRIVPQIIETFGAYETRKISQKPFLMLDTQADDLIELLKAPHRTLPIIFISVSNKHQSPATDPLLLANRLAGVAYVVRAESSILSWQLSNKIGPGLNAYDGAVRLYWPNFASSDSRFRHPMYTPERVKLFNESSGGFATHLLRKIAAVSTHRRITDVFLWEDAERHAAAIHLKELREARKDQDLLALYEAENNQIQNENKALKKTLDDLQDELQKSHNEAENWRLTALELQKQIPGATPSLSPTDPQVVPLLKAEEAVQRVFEELSDCIEFTPRAISQSDSCNFKDVEGLYKALRWVASTYRSCRVGQLRIDDLGADCKKASGFDFSPHQSEITMSKYKSDYTVTWKGKKQVLKAHVGRGSSRNPEDTIRVAFFFDEDSKKVVVGYIGQHQQTAKS